MLSVEDKPHRSPILLVWIRIDLAFFNPRRVPLSILDPGNFVLNQGATHQNGKYRHFQPSDVITPKLDLGAGRISMYRHLTHVPHACAILAGATVGPRLAASTISVTCAAPAP